MRLFKITALLLAGILLLTSCGNAAETANAKTSETQKKEESTVTSPQQNESEKTVADVPRNEPGAANEDTAAESDASAISGITAVEAVNPEPIGQGMDADAFTTGDAYWDWWQSMQGKIETSANAQEGMDRYYEAMLKELLSGNDDENAVCSPLNIYVALAMLAEVTDGNTRTQILDTLQAENIEQLRSRIQALWDANYVDTPVVKSLLADAMWLRNDLGYHEDTLKRLAEVYHASSYSGEMGSEEMNEMLRKWTDEHTGGLLSEYTSGMELRPETVLALVSTIYYKAAWTDSFQKERTDTAVFHAAAGDQQVPMMHMDEMMTYYRAKKFQAAGLGLVDSGTMYFMLPEEGTDVKEIVTDPEAIGLLRNHDDPEVSYPLVHLSVPKFKVSGKTDLMEHLSLLGITDVTDADAADFSPLTDEAGNLFLSGAEHAAMVEIDEDGVTGAAYTALITDCAGMFEPEEVEFVLDRPFYFAVTGRDGSILFAGIVQTVE